MYLSNKIWLIKNNIMVIRGYTIFIYELKISMSRSGERRVVIILLLSSYTPSKGNNSINVRYI